MNSAPLSPLEAGFLYAESASTPMNIGSLSIFDGTGWRGRDGKLQLDMLQSHIEAKFMAVPRVFQHPVWPLGRAARPRWVDDKFFDITRHVRAMTLPPPGTEEQLMAVVEDQHMKVLDRSHPLWELWFIDGLDGGRVAVLEKIHHSLVDGIGGVDLSVMLLDVEPTGARSVSGGPPAIPSLVDRLFPFVWAVQAAMDLPLAIAKDLTVLATSPLSAFRRGRQLTGASLSMLTDLLAPRSSLNQQIGTTRRYRVIRRSLDQTRETAHALGGTVNDLVLSAVSAGLQELVSSRNESLHSAHLHALVPVSMRSDHDHGDLGNRVAALIVPLPVRELEPDERFAMVCEAVRTAREHHEMELSHALLTVMQIWPEPVIASVADLMHHQPVFNLVVSNVPGPPIPLYFMEAQMLEAFPLVPLARNLTLSIGILSYHHQLTLGLWADHDLFPDLDLLVSQIDAGFAAMEKATPRFL
jgi:diacylglycerol O-acyltransferase / wax synthase